MNELTPRIITGTTGELLVQLRLFQYSVQAAPPLKDSGNDLIAVRGLIFKSIQVKTTGNENGTWTIPTGRQYHILALVRLRGDKNELSLDNSEVYLLPRETVDSGDYDLNDLDNFLISQEVVDNLFPPQN